MRNGAQPQRHFTDEENARLRVALEDLRARLREVRGKPKISDDVLAEAIGITGPGVKKYAAGGGFSRAAAEGVARGLGVPLADLLGHPAQVFLVANVPDPELRAVLEYFQGRRHGWSDAAIGAAIGLSMEGQRHAREDWEQLLGSLTAKLAKPR